MNLQKQAPDWKVNLPPRYLMHREKAQRAKACCGRNYAYPSYYIFLLKAKLLQLGGSSAVLRKQRIATLGQSGSTIRRRQLCYPFNVAN
ncbi:hypothetical protein [Caballeronia arationis]|jgi:hypothetical protein|uniref:hypothetical protein n=1 Tax=Caballeronia arationis TaxID=1777142 RepID=UPI001F20EDC7|nr:hypothetical protein [Caballeronia arationis]